MKTIKVSTPWYHTDYYTHIPVESNNMQYRFTFNDEEKNCDYWVVWGGIKQEKLETYCPPENIIYLTDEVHDHRFFNKYFLNQFAAIITCRKDIQHRRVIPSHELNTWIIDKTFTECLLGFPIEKTKSLSVVCSDHVWLQGHKDRFALVNKLIGHFKDKLDVYGRGFNEIKDKSAALIPYKYSIAIENSFIPGYFTEKLTDCFLAETLPLYYGCPDGENYFPPKSFERIEIKDYRRIIQQIEQIVEDDLYSQRLTDIKTAKSAYLDRLHIFSALPNIIQERFKGSPGKKIKCTIRNEQSFWSGQQVNNRINKIFRALHLPGRFYFSIQRDQSKLYANPPGK